MTNKDKAQRVKKVMDETVAIKLASYSKDKVEENIKNYISKASETSILSALGIDKTWSATFVVKDNSPLRSRLDEVVKLLLEDITFEKPTLTDKDYASLKKTFDSEYKRTLRERVEAYARDMTYKDVEAVIEIIEGGSE
jgi:hypothetical protein